MTRVASSGDRADFERLWTEFGQESQLLGYPLEDTSAEINRSMLLFDAYVSKQLKGVALMVDRDAGLLWGETGLVMPRLVFGPAAFGFGVYVRPARRREGIAGSLIETAKWLLREMGFQAILCSPYEGAGHGATMLQRAGFRPLQITMVYDLEEGA